MEVSGQLHASTALPQGKSPWYQLHMRLGGPQSRSELCGEEKNSQPLPGLEPLIPQPTAQSYTIELCRFQPDVTTKVKIVHIKGMCKMNCSLGSLGTLHATPPPQSQAHIAPIRNRCTLLICYLGPTNQQYKQFVMENIKFN
jgi:hypothetical protein